MIKSVRTPAYFREKQNGRVKETTDLAIPEETSNFCNILCEAFPAFKG